MKKPTGYVIYEGVSQLDGVSPIVGIITMKSANVKTGNMAQLLDIKKRYTSNRCKESKF